MRTIHLLKGKTMFNHRPESEKIELCRMKAALSLVDQSLALMDNLSVFEHKGVYTDWVVENELDNADYYLRKAQDHKKQFDSLKSRNIFKRLLDIK